LLSRRNERFLDERADRGLVTSKCVEGTRERRGGFLNDAERAPPARERRDELRRRERGIAPLSELGPRGVQSAAGFRHSLECGVTRPRDRSIVPVCLLRIWQRCWFDAWVG
jgi:hypothetical protein